jgi:hypothetical protein
MRRSGAELVHGPSRKEGVEDAGQAAGERDDGDLLAAAGRDAKRPASQGVGRGRAAPRDGDGGLNQEPPHAGVAGLGDVATALGLARAALAGHEAKVRLDLVGVPEALDIIDGGDEGGGGDRADAGDGAQTLDARIVGGEVLDGLVGVRELGVEVTHDRQQGGDRGEQPARQRHGGDGTTRMSGTSMAAPHVTGVVALMWEAVGPAGVLDPEEARGTIRTSADRLTVAPLDSPTTSYTQDGEREGIAQAQ